MEFSESQADDSPAAWIGTTGGRSQRAGPGGRGQRAEPGGGRRRRKVNVFRASGSEKKREGDSETPLRGAGLRSGVASRFRPPLRPLPALSSRFSRTLPPNHPAKHGTPERRGSGSAPLASSPEHSSLLSPLTGMTLPARAGRFGRPDARRVALPRPAACADPPTRVSCPWPRRGPRLPASRPFHVLPRVTPAPSGRAPYTARQKRRMVTFVPRGSRQRTFTKV